MKLSINITKDQISIIKAIGKDASRPNLQSIHFEGNKAIVTDGRIMIIASGDNADAEYKFTLEREAVEKIDGFMKSLKVDSCTIFTNAENEAIVNVGEHQLVFKPLDCYPQWQQVVPGDDERPQSFCCDVRLLERICKAMKAAGRDNDSKNHIRVSMVDANNSIVIERLDKSMKAILMPIRGY